MKEKILEVQNYFKNKLLSGEFTPTSINGEYLTVSIDGCEFEIWMGLGYCDIASLSRGSFMKVPISREEQRTLHLLTKDPYEKLKKEFELNTKKAEFEKLKTELGL